jgi:glycosyl transferase family 25
VNPARVFVLSLDRTPERFATFQSFNAHLAQIDRVSAIDGATLDIPHLIDIGFVAPGFTLEFYHSPELGLALSNLALWGYAIKNGAPITIAEDDAIFNHHFELSAKAVLRSMPAQWDFILWGFNFDSWVWFDALPGTSWVTAQFDQNTLRNGITAFQEQTIEPRAYPIKRAFGTPCYSISPRGAFKLLSRILPLSPLIVPGNVPTIGFDVQLNVVYTRDSYVCFPPLVVTKNEQEHSTLRGNKNNPEPGRGPIRKA